MKSKISFLFFLFFFIFFLREIDLTTTDLGRHIKNGEMILRGDTLEKVLSANFYSYVYPEFPFVNHHWGSGVIFYLVQRFFGFAGISLFFAGLSAVTFLVFFRLAWKKSTLMISALSVILIIPLIFLRTEIRPEAFSYLFCGIYWLILSNNAHCHPDPAIGGRRIPIESCKPNGILRRFTPRNDIIFLPLLQLLWVNLHSYFFLGFILMGAFGLEEIFKGNFKGVKKLAVVIILSVFASFINPAGVKGFLYPLHIFDNFGYRLLENQSTFFLERVIGEYPAGIYFRILFLLLAFSFVWKWAKEKKIELVDFLLAIFVSVIAFKAVRNFAVFGFFCLPIIAQNLSNFRLHKDEAINKFAFVLLGTVLVPAIFFIKPQYWLQRNKIGFGLETGEKEAAEFFLSNKLKGPVFNNYDIGGYLIYYLFPQGKVFVDNRPEAYQADFFEKVYIPMQEQRDKWNKADKEYNFNTVFFYRLDLTPWAQTFLLNLIDDKNWAPVYVDGKRIIFLKRVKQNEELIKKFALPREMFSAKQ